MANEKNLIPVTKRTPREQKEISSKGGKASAEARRRRKTMKENAELLLSLSVKNPKLKKIMKELGINEDDQTNQMAMIISLMNKVITRGDVSAFNSLQATIGEKPKETVEIEGNITKNPLEGLTTDELRKTIELMNNANNK